MRTDPARLPRLGATRSDERQPARMSDAAARGDLLRVVADSLPTGVLLVRADGTILLVNRYLEGLFDYSRGELVGQSLNLVVPEGLHSLHARHRELFHAASDVPAIDGGDR